MNRLTDRKSNSEKFSKLNTQENVKLKKIRIMSSAHAFPIYGQDSYASDLMNTCTKDLITINPSFKSSRSNYYYTVCTVINIHI
jgi:hypothetical protein